MLEIPTIFPSSLLIGEYCTETARLRPSLLQQSVRKGLTDSLKTKLLINYQIQMDEGYQKVWCIFSN